MCARVIELSPKERALVLQFDGVDAIAYEDLDFHARVGCFKKGLLIGGVDVGSRYASVPGARLSAEGAEVLAALLG